MVAVSIHAPTQGATIAGSKELFCRKVSIHAPTQGATQKSVADRVKDGVSIHAPTQGATATRPLPQQDCIFRSIPVHIPVAYKA